MSEVQSITLDDLAKYYEQDGFIQATYLCYKNNILLEYIAIILFAFSTVIDGKSFYLYTDDKIIVVATVIEGKLYLNKQVLLDIKVDEIQ